MSIWKNKNILKRVVYVLCFAFLCLIDQRTKTGSGLDGWIEFFRDMLGVVMAVLLLARYRLTDFREHRVIYLIWNGAALVGGVLFCIYGTSIAYFLNDRVAIALSAMAFGNIIVHTVLDVALTRKLPPMRRWFGVLWLAMMVWMICSRSEYFWPFAYLLLFGCFYLAEETPEERSLLWMSAADGIILAFFLMQGWCFVFRPYDVERYVGVYSNCNLNALFYLVVLAAVFAKLLYHIKNHSQWWIKGFYWLGTGVLYAFLFLTIGRTAWIASFVMGLFFLIAVNSFLGKKRLLRNGACLILSACLMFPAVFGAVRYLPPVFHHPVWFWGEWNENKVHSWDSWGSDKFIDLDEFLTAAVGRVMDIWDGLADYLSITAEAAEVTADMTAEEKYQIMLEQGYASASLDSTPSPLETRGKIYRYYFDHLNLTGHPYSEQGFQFLPTYWIGHAHDLFLQWGTDFGIPVMVILVILAVSSLVILFRRTLRERSIEAFLGLQFLLVIYLFGLFEYAWGEGSITVVLMFLAWSQVIRRDKQQSIEEGK